MKLRLFAMMTLAAMIVGCTGGKEESGSPKETAAPDKSTFKVALVTPSEVNDSGWSAIAYDGLKGIEEEFGAEIQNVVASTPQEIRDAYRSYAQKGFNLIIGHGYEYNQHGIEIGKDFPKTIFVSSSGDKTAENVGCFRFYLEQGMYVLGVVAGKMTKTNVVGMVGGPEVPSIQSTFDGFEAGVKSVNPSCKVLRAFTGSNDDVGKAKQQTLAMIDQKADFIIHQANAAANGVFEACKERGIMAFGTNSDQNSVSPDTILGSAVIVARPAFKALANQVMNGTYKGTVTLSGMESGAVSVVWNPALVSKIPADVKKLADDTATKIRSGEIEVPMRKF